MCARARPPVTQSCLAVDRRAQDRAPKPTSVRPSRRPCKQTSSDLGFGEKVVRAFDVLVAWMVAEGYLGQLEAAIVNPRCRLDLVESDCSTSSSSTGSDEMMQGAAADPLSSPEVVTIITITIITIITSTTTTIAINILAFAAMSSTMSTMACLVLSRLTNVSVFAPLQTFLLLLTMPPIIHPNHLSTESGLKLLTQSDWNQLKSMFGDVLQFSPIGTILYQPHH